MNWRCSAIYINATKTANVNIVIQFLKTGWNLTSKYDLVKGGFKNNTFSLLTPSFFSPSPGKTPCLCLTFLSFFYHRNLRENNPMLL